MLLGLRGWAFRHLRRQGAHLVTAARDRKRQDRGASDLHGLSIAGGGKSPCSSAFLAAAAIALASLGMCLTAHARRMPERRRSAHAATKTSEKLAVLADCGAVFREERVSNGMRGHSADTLAAIDRSACGNALKLLARQSE
jgi:hypothetical protein